MNETYVTIRGRLVADPTVRTTRTGAPMTVFRVASSARRPVPGQNGAWEDTEASFYDVVTYRSLAANVGVSVRKGHPVTIHGRQHISSRPREDGTTWWSVEVVADSVGHDLTYGTTAFAKASRGQFTDGERPGRADGAGVAETTGFGDPERDPYVVEGTPGRGLGEVFAPGGSPPADGSDGLGGSGSLDAAGPPPTDSGPLVPAAEEDAA